MFLYSKNKQHKQKKNKKRSERKSCSHFTCSVHFVHSLRAKSKPSLRNWGVGLEACIFRSKRL
ncbi:hypothetical protein WZ342_2484 [Enterococcus faecalis]|nr:hypothetical protein WZ342_2484 [Enterococcus faecalis]